MAVDERRESPRFELVWTVGFSGKRFVEVGRERAIRDALRLCLADLSGRAREQGARLTAVSSLARGGDVLFAEAIATLQTVDSAIPWKCLLPFAWEEFIRRDLAAGPDGQTLPDDEASEIRRRADVCIGRSHPAAQITSSGADPSNDEHRAEAYLECGYRTVDESDVMVLLLRQREVEALLSTDAPLVPPPRRRGTFAAACYARAAGRPMIVLNADAADVWATRSVLNAPETKAPSRAWFVDGDVSGLILKACAGKVGGGSLPSEATGTRSGPKTALRESVGLVGARLGALADEHQRSTLGGLRMILRLHLGASTLAALAATVLVLKNPHALPLALLVPLVLLAFVKPALAGSAWWLEHRLHHLGDRELWLTARTLAELCRGAVATWPLPLQPVNAVDEEDFPKVKRVIRTLRLLREQDAAAAVHGTPRQPEETELQADMRAACAFYARDRLLDQASYYESRLKSARASEQRWRSGFLVATWAAVVLGLSLAIDRSALALGHHLLSGLMEPVLEAGVIIAPFVAAHCLSMMAILDSRRRSTRYAEIAAYLRRLADTLEKTDANPSRLRLVEHAEGLLIEEQHEWLSVMRNLVV
jgi:hypothetical protein